MRYIVENGDNVTFVNSVDSLKFIRCKCNKCGKQFTLIRKIYDKVKMFVCTDSHKCNESCNSRIYATPIEESFVPFEDDDELSKKELSGEIIHYKNKYYYKKDIHELKVLVKEELPTQDSKVIFVVKNEAPIYTGIYSAKKKRWYNGFYIEVASSFKTKDIYAWNLIE